MFRNANIIIFQDICEKIFGMEVFFLEKYSLHYQIIMRLWLNTICMDRHSELVIIKCSILT